MSGRPLVWIAGDIAVNCLNGRVGKILERYSVNFHFHYADFRIWFLPEDEYRIVRARHLRPPMPGEIRAYQRAINPRAVRKATP